jgi:hypothetical protein
MRENKPMMTKVRIRRKKRSLRRKQRRWRRNKYTREGMTVNKKTEVNE